MPYNPGVEYRGDVHIAQGAARGKDNLFAALISLGNHLGEQSEKQKSEAKQFKSLVDYAEASGIGTKDELITKSLPEVEGIVKGRVAKRDQEREVQKARFMEAQVKAMESSGAAGQALTSFARDFAGGAMEPSGLGWMTDGYPAEDQSPAARLQYALGRNPQAFAAPQFDNSLQSLMRVLPGANAMTPGVPQAMPGLSDYAFVPLSPTAGTVVPVQRNAPKAASEKDRADIELKRAQTNKLKAEVGGDAGGARISALQGAIGTLKNLQSRGVKKVEVEDLAKLKLDDNPWWGGEPIDTVIKGFQSEIDSLRGAGGQPMPNTADPDQVDAMIQQGNDAIARGADPAKVKARLKAMGITTK